PVTVVDDRFAPPALPRAAETTGFNARSAFGTSGPGGAIAGVAGHDLAGLRPGLLPVGVPERFHRGEVIPRASVGVSTDDAFAVQRNVLAHLDPLIAGR